MKTIFCMLGMHGPNWVGDRHHEPLSERTAGFERTCRLCGAVWHGRQVERYFSGQLWRTSGDWRRVAKPLLRSK
jgi:hypothetical protein